MKITTLTLVFGWMALCGIGCAEVAPESEPTSVEPPLIENAPTESEGNALQPAEVHSDKIEEGIDTLLERFPEERPAEGTVATIAQPVPIATVTLRDYEQEFQDILDICSSSMPEALRNCLDGFRHRENQRWVGSATAMILDLDGDDLELEDLGVSPDDGVLILDRNGDGQVQPEDLFGESSVTGRTVARNEADPWEIPNSFEDLALLDADGDGFLTERDPVFDQLRIWVDSIQNRRLDAGEAVTLPAAGVAEIGTAYFAVNDGTAIRERGIYRSTLALMIEGQLERL